MRRAVLASLLVCARIGADDCEQSGTLTFAYFAVGQRTLTKARRSAVSAKRAHAGRAVIRARRARVAGRWVPSGGGLGSGHGGGGG